MPVVAATNDLIFSEDITVSGITLGSGTTNMTVFASSSAESFDIASGVFTITNPGSSFNAGSANASVGIIIILKSGAMESCTANTVPGTSSTTLPTASGVYTIRPLEATSCSGLCSSLTGAATYNAYPTCGASTCSSGYTLSGSGSSATCSVQSSGGGGGGSYIPPSTTADQDENISTIQSFVTSSDGTSLSSETKTTKSDSGVVEKVEIETTITASEDVADTQTVKLDSSETADVKEIKLEMEKEIIKEIIGTSTNKEIKVNIISQEATTVQKNITARGGKFLLGYDIFSIDIQTGKNKINKFVNPLKLTFDISNIADKSDLKIYYFDELTNKWEIAGNGGVIAGDNIIVEVYHLTDFSLMKDVEEDIEVDVNEFIDREKQMLQIEDDANAVFISGIDLNTILIHNNVEKDTEMQSKGMNKYIPELKENISGLTMNNIYAINNFIMYGSITTEKLGAGERAGVVNSYKKAFGKLPLTKEEWKDCIAIGNGRWPRETSTTAEATASEEFKKIYLRDANMDNPNDNAAVTIISYGLRPSDRNTESERAGINIFKGIYKYNPTLALDWDIVRAISYSGATR
ncbi:MAG: hypothetical protein U9Q85_01350 [Patescibacteria group bacterium]|nr:hypothetical protein [Patescibacteria group bacterium]